MHPLDLKYCLGSKSPRRRKMFTDCGLSYRTVITHFDESFTGRGSRAELVKNICEEKINTLKKHCLAHEYLICADTMVFRGGEPLGKPKSEKLAREMLYQLSGNSHEVISAVGIYHKEQILLFSDKTSVQFNFLNERVLENYVKSRKGLDKAGGYGIQDIIGMVGIHSIQGSYYNVMGFPMSKFMIEVDKFSDFFKSK